MSRRQRRRTNQSAPTHSRKSSPARNSGKHKKSGGRRWKILASVLGVFLVIGIVVYNRVIAYLHSEEFRKNISEQVGFKTGTSAELADFKWSGFKGENPSFNATGEGMIQSVSAKDMSFDVDFSYIKRDVFKLKQVKLGSVEAVIDLQKKFLKFEPKKRERSFFERLLPNRAELYDAQINKLSATVLTAGDGYAAHGVMTFIEKVEQGSGYDVKLEGGRFTVPLDLLDNAYLKVANLKLRGEEIYINNARFTVQESGLLELNGYVDLAEHASRRYELGGSLSGLRCKDVFPPDWQKNLKGEVVADFSVKPYKEQLPIFRGHLEIKNGRLEALPILNDVAFYLAESQYRILRFDKLECDFEKHEGRTSLSSIVLSSKGLIKIEGFLNVDKGKLDGVFNIGLPAQKLRNIPGAEDSVFVSGKEGLNWAKVRISGTVDDVKEDLTDRLIAAAGQRIMDEALRMGGEIIHPDRIKGGIKDGMKVTEDVLKGDKSIAEGVSGILDTVKKQVSSSLKELSEDKNKESEKDDKEDKEGEDDKKEKGSLLPIPLPDPRKIPDILPF